MLKLITFDDFIFEASVGYDYTTETYSDSDSLEYHLTRFTDLNKERGIAFNIYKIKKTVGVDIIKTNESEEIYITEYKNSFDEAKKEVLKLLRKKRISFSSPLRI
jgi:hypothetical protein